MGQQYGPAQPIVDVFTSAEQKVENLLGDPTKSASKPYQMKDIPADNPNRKAWEAAMTFHGPPKTAPKKATRKPARKR